MPSTAGPNGLLDNRRLLRPLHHPDRAFGQSKRPQPQHGPCILRMDGPFSGHSAASADLVAAFRFRGKTVSKTVTEMVSKTTRREIAPTFLSSAGDRHTTHDLLITER
jgi:hypothetical protein